MLEVDAAQGRCAGVVPLAEPRRRLRLFQRERVAGIEPAWPAWKAGALPLSYTRRSPASVAA